MNLVSAKIVSNTVTLVKSHLTFHIAKGISSCNISLRYKLFLNIPYDRKKIVGGSWTNLLYNCQVKFWLIHEVQKIKGGEKTFV